MAVSEIDSLTRTMGITEAATRMKYTRLMKRLDEAELKHLRSKRAQQMAARK